MALRIFLAAAKSAVISFLSPALASAVFMAAHPSIFLGPFSLPFASLGNWVPVLTHGAVGAVDAGDL
jgi:hypothetical protein